jgi:hypothetical protein
MKTMHKYSRRSSKMLTIHPEETPTSSPSTTKDYTLVFHPKNRDGSHGASQKECVPPLLLPPLAKATPTSPQTPDT